MRESRRIKFTVALMLGAGAVAAVSAFSALQRPHPLPPLTVHPVAAQSQVRLPIDSYATTFSAQVLVGQAVTKLADACLSAHGVTVPPVFLGHANPPIADLNESTVLLLTLASAEKYGFNAPESAGMASYQSIVWARGGVFGLTRVQGQALYGSAPGNSATASAKVPNGGCLGQAATAITAGVGSVPQLSASANDEETAGYKYFELVWPGLPLQIEETAANEALSDARTQAVTAQWHACMKSNGYNYADPVGALGDPRWAPSTSSSASRQRTAGLQIAVAVADARCQQRTDFPGVKLAVLSFYQSKLIAANRPQLLIYKSEVSRIIANAKAVLGRSKP